MTPETTLRVTPDDGALESTTLLPKVIGADVELGNFVTRVARTPSGWSRESSDRIFRTLGPDPDDAARAIVAEFQGVPSGHQELLATAWRGGGDRPGSARRTRAHAGWVDPQDRERKFLSTGVGCVYIDLSHTELCAAETTSAFDHVAIWHAMLRTARLALDQANAKQPEGETIHLLANTSDGLGHSWGSHLSFLITRRAFDRVCTVRRLDALLWLASFQSSAIIYAGAGKVGAENGAPHVGYQLSQRADFIETLFGSQTTYQRPLVNSRDEPLCGSVRGTRRHARSDMARLHVICFDTNLCQHAALVKVGAMQIVLAMLEAEVDDFALALEDPVEAMGIWSRDLTLGERVPLMRGGATSALQLQSRFLEQARAFVQQGRCEGIVPRAAEIIACWEEALDTLRRGDLREMATKFDWALKLEVLGKALRANPSLDLQSAEMKHLDHLYASVATDGIYWACERAGLVHRLVDDVIIERFVHEPPEDTRAWTRAQLLRRLGKEQVDAVDWDYVRCRVGWGQRPGTTKTIHLEDPNGYGRAATEPLFAQAKTDSALLNLFSAECDTQQPQHLTRGSHQ